MSRLSTMSPAALRALFSPEADDTLAILLTLSGGGLPSTLRITDNYTGRLSETDADVMYGLTSRGNAFYFYPFSMTLPSEDADAAIAAEVILHDLDGSIRAAVRGLTGPISVLIELVLLSTPDVVEVSFGTMKCSSIPYSDQITLSLSVDSESDEPFPCGTFTPSSFPGVF